MPVKKKKSTAKKGTKASNTARVKKISARAKQIYAKSNIKWTSAISKASKELKAEGVI